LLLFLSTWLIGSAGAVLGSMIGAAFGNASLFAGAVLGGAIATAVAVRLAVWRGWILRERSNRVMIGALIGFAIAAIIATQTLSSPIGPVASSLLIGVGAVLANRR
jgi:uncharacterized membrane protein